MYNIFIGITIRKNNKILTEDELSILQRYKISVKETPTQYLLYYHNHLIKRDISKLYELTLEDINIISLKSHELHYLQGCLKRTPIELYNSYDDNFGFHQI